MQTMNTILSGLAAAVILAMAVYLVALALFAPLFLYRIWKHVRLLQIRLAPDPVRTPMPEPEPEPVRAAVDKFGGSTPDGW
jgi:hypothetical protein